MNVVNELLGVVGNDEQDDGGGYMRVSETREGGTWRERTCGRTESGPLLEDHH